MALPPWDCCGQSRGAPCGCTVDAVPLTDGDYRRLPYGQGQGDAGHKLPEICHDCGCPLGALHHVGCDMEECPRCHEPFLGCLCMGDPADFETLDIEDESD